MDRKQNRAVSKISQWHRKNRWTSAIFSKPWASFLVIWPWKLSCFFSARTPTALVSISSWLLNASLFWPISSYLTELKRGRAVVGCRAQGKEAAALGCRWPCLPAQPSTGSPKVVTQRLLTSFYQRPLLYYKQQRRIIHKFIWDFMLFRELFSFATKNKDFFNVLFFLYQVSQYVCCFGNCPIVRGTKDCFS